MREDVKRILEEAARRIAAPAVNDEADKARWVRFAADQAAKNLSAVQCYALELALDGWRPPRFCGDMSPGCEPGIPGFTVKTRVGCTLPADGHEAHRSATFSNGLVMEWRTGEAARKALP